VCGCSGIVRCAHGQKAEHEQSITDVERARLKRIQEMAAEAEAARRELAKHGLRQRVMLKELRKYNLDRVARDQAREAHTHALIEDERRALVHTFGSAAQGPSAYPVARFTRSTSITGVRELVLGFFEMIFEVALVPERSGSF
jgi:hypothetical protein